MSDKNRPFLVLDTASPQVSVALGTVDRVIASRTLELHRSSELLLRAVEEILEQAGETLTTLGGVAVLQGPGSFTGLRIGLATVLGWHQALGLRATALPTLEVLAASVPTTGDSTDVIAAVDALRGDWAVRRFRGREALGEAALMAGRDLALQGPCRLVGFGISRLADEPWWNEAAAVTLVEPPPLAAVAIALAAAASDWRPERLTTPIYFRPPAVSLPKLRARQKGRRERLDPTSAGC